MKEKWTPHIIAVNAFVVFIVLGLACASKPDVPSETVSTTGTQSEGDFNVDLTADGSGVVITGYTGSQRAVTIPAQIQGYPVKEIHNGAFSLAEKRIWDDDDVYLIKIIEKGTNTRLTSVTLPTGLITIGKGAFYKQSITSVNIPASVTSIGDYAFSECSSLATVNIPAGVTSIGDYAFSECSSLAAVNIPASVTSIGNYAFYGCSKLATVNFSEGLVKIGVVAFLKCSALKTIKLPNSLTELGDSVFASSGLTAVTLGTGLTYIPSGTFAETSIITIVIPEGVTRIFEYAFISCTALTSVTLPSTLVEIKTCAFKGCSALTTVTIPSALISVQFGDGATFLYNSGRLVLQRNGVFDGCEKLLLATRTALKKLGWNGEPLTETVIRYEK
jgi:hypothetical protein